MAQVRDKDQVKVSIYPFTDEEIDLPMNSAPECVVTWSTKDGWPVGVIHSFVCAEETTWLTFSSHRNRAHALRRDPRVSASVSALTCLHDAPGAAPIGAITFKGQSKFIDGETKRKSMHDALASHTQPDSKAGRQAFRALLDSPLRAVLAITPSGKIIYNGSLSAKLMAETIDEAELGERPSSDAALLKRETAKGGLPER